MSCQVRREDEQILRKRKREVVFPSQVEEDETVIEEQEKVISPKSTTEEQPAVRLINNYTGSLRSIHLKSIVQDPSHILLLNNLAKVMSIVTVEDLFLAQKSEIQRRLKVSAEELEQIYIEVSSKAIPKRISTLELEQNQKICHKKLTLGCPIIDTALNGGILTKNIVEICGEASSGKTQFCLQASLYCMLPEDYGGLGGKVLYISTNDFPRSRYKTMADLFVKKCKSQNITIDPYSEIFPEQASDLTKLWSILHDRLPILIKNPAYKIKLIVIDSLAALVRSEYEHGQSIERSRSLWLISSQLRKLADLYNCSVLIVNQVTDKFDNNTNLSTVHGNSSSKYVPSLGLAWSKCINTRIILTRTQLQYDIDPESRDTTNSEEEPSPKKQKVSSSVVRELSILFSSTIPSNTCNFIVNNSGIIGIDEVQ